MPRKKKEDVQAQKSAGQADDIAQAVETRNLFHRFTEDEIDGLNEKVTELTEKKNAFAEKAKLMGDIAKGSDAEIKHTIGLIKEGGEERALECPVEINYTQSTYTVKHPETGDVLDVRPLTAAEKQRELFPQEGPEDAPAADGQSEESLPQEQEAQTEDEEEPELPETEGAPEYD